MLFNISHSFGDNPVLWNAQIDTFDGAFVSAYSLTSYGTGFAEI
jgi:hypothetical protein